MTADGQPRPRVEVYFQPPAAQAVAGRTLVVIDTLRATTVITTLIAGGAAAVYPCRTPDEARALAAELPGARLCGERGGLPVEGFEFGNSAAEFAALDVRGWTVVQSTSNGTRALALTREAASTLVACLRNREAAARAAFATGADIAVVCSGEHDGLRPSVEDAFTAGALVERLLALAPGLATGAGARLARRVWQSYGGSGRAAFADSPHAASLRGLGFDADLAFAADEDVVDVAPGATIDEAGRVVVRGDARG